MSFFHKQRIITLVSRLSFFFILLFSFTTARLPAISPLSDAGTAALFALIISFPIGHATSFWYMTTSNLTFLTLVYALFDLAFRSNSWYETWRTVTLHGFLPIILCVVYILAGLFVAKKIRRKRYSVTTRHPLPSGRLKIVQLSDTHPWRLQTKAELAYLKRIISEEKPDIIALTGDIFDENTTPKMFRQYTELFAELQPKYGKYYIFGNHDTSSHWKTPAHTREDIVREFEKAGITILEDEADVIADGKVRVVGRRDLEEPRLSPAELYEKVGIFDGFELLLCHEPVELRECADRGGADLILAGHTHGGQIFPVGLVARLLKVHEGNVGMIPLTETSNAIISSGVGTWSYPIRTEARSEVVVVEVREGKR